MCLIPQERIQQRTIDDIGVVPIPQIQEHITDVLQVFSLERTHNDATGTTFQCISSTKQIEVSLDLVVLSFSCPVR